MKQKNRTCNIAPRHFEQSIVGICLEYHCRMRSYACQKCIAELHNGHLVLHFDYLQTMEQELAAQAIYEPASKTAVQNHYNSLKLQCQKLLVTSSAKMSEELEKKEPFLSMITSNLRNVKMKQIIRQLIAQKDIPQEVMAEYINALRTYYLQGGSSKLHPPTNGYKIEAGIKRLVQQSQRQIAVILKNLVTKIINYKNVQPIQEEPLVKKEDIGEGALLFQQNIKPGAMADENKERPTLYEHNKQIILKHNLFRDTKLESERMRKIILRETRQARIDELLYCIDADKVEELTIINSAAICVLDQKSVTQIAKMINLKRLRIFWAKGMQDDQVIMMTKYMTKLQELCLCQMDTCKAKLVNALRINNPNLHKIVFSIDLKHFVRYNEENLQFMLDWTFYYTQESAWITLTNGLANLSNVQLNLPQNIKHWTNFVQSNKLNLRQFTLMACRGQINRCNEYKPQAQDKSVFLQAIEKCSNLQCLRLQQITFKDKSFKKIIENNKKLLSLVLSECPSIKAQSYTNIFKHCPQLEEFSLQMDDRFTGNGLYQLSSLKTLVLRCCWGVDQQTFIENLQKLNSLKCLVIDFNHYWITGKTIKTLKLLPKLKILNISNNQLQENDIWPLRNLNSLQTLICYNNWFSYTELIDLLSSKKIKKLSIGKNVKKFVRDQYERIQMKDIVLAFPALTHLKINGFNGIQPEYLKLLSRLICLTIVGAPREEIGQAEKYCNQAKIYIHYPEDKIQQDIAKQQENEYEEQEGSEFIAKGLNDK